MADQETEGSKKADQEAEGSNNADQEAEGSNNADQETEGSKRADQETEGSKKADQEVEGNKKADQQIEEHEENPSALDVTEKEKIGQQKSTQQEKEKITILLKATSDAPIMKKKKWAVESSQTIGWIIKFIRGYLKLEDSDSLFLYVNQAFAPSADQEVKNIYECFGSDGKLVLHYAKSQAWG